MPDISLEEYLQLPLPKIDRNLIDSVIHAKDTAPYTEEDAKRYDRTSRFVHNADRIEITLRDMADLLEHNIKGLGGDPSKSPMLCRIKALLADLKG